MARYELPIGLIVIGEKVVPIRRIMPGGTGVLATTPRILGSAHVYACATPDVRDRLQWYEWVTPEARDRRSGTTGGSPPRALIETGETS